MRGVTLRKYLRNKKNLRSHFFFCTFAGQLCESMKIKLFLTDVDGCLTDGGMYYSANGDEMKKFCVYDGMGMVLLRQAGIKCGILTSETTDIVVRRANKLKLDYLRQGVGAHNKLSKLDAAKEICAELHISLDEVCYVGDDINDVDLLRSVGLAACPASALPIVKSLPNIRVLERNGGEGAIRELCDWILENN